MAAGSDFVRNRAQWLWGQRKSECVQAAQSESDLRPYAEMPPSRDGAAHNSFGDCGARGPIQGVCYLDEALALDARNQRSLIETAAEFGFSLIFASPAPLTTVRYCVPIHHRHGSSQISRLSWQVIEPLEA